jgi:hypothetical protein
MQRIATDASVAGNMTVRSPTLSAEYTRLLEDSPNLIARRRPAGRRIRPVRLAEQADPDGRHRPARRLQVAVKGALDDPKAKKTFERSGIDTRRVSIDASSAFVSKQVTDWAAALEASGAKLG